MYNVLNKKDSILFNMIIITIKKRWRIGKYLVLKRGNIVDQK